MHKHVNRQQAAEQRQAKGQREANCLAGHHGFSGENGRADSDEAHTRCKVAERSENEERRPSPDSPRALVLDICFVQERADACDHEPKSHERQSRPDPSQESSLVGLQDAKVDLRRARRNVSALFLLSRSVRRFFGPLHSVRIPHASPDHQHEARPVVRTVK